MKTLPIQSNNPGWLCWLIVLGGFVCYLIADGCSYSFAILYQDLLNEFNETHYYTSWVGALLYGVPQLTSPLACAFVDAWESRVPTTLGTAGLVIAFLLTSTASSMLGVLLTLGLVLPFGLQLLYVSAIVKVSRLFASGNGRCLGLALGVLTCGSGVGWCVFPPLLELLSANFGWRGACLIFSAVVFNGLVSAALFGLVPTPAPAPAPLEAAPTSPPADETPVRVHYATALQPEPDASQTQVSSSQAVKLEMQSASKQQQTQNPRPKNPPNLRHVKSSISKRLRNAFRSLRFNFHSRLRELCSSSLYTRNRQFLPLLGLCFTVNLTVVSVLTYSVDVATRDAGATKRQAALVQSAIGASACVGQLLFGFVATLRPRALCHSLCWRSSRRRRADRSEPEGPEAEAQNQNVRPSVSQEQQQDEGRTRETETTDTQRGHDAGVAGGVGSGVGGMSLPHMLFLLGALGLAVSMLLFVLPAVRASLLAMFLVAALFGLSFGSQYCLTSVLLYEFNGESLYSASLSAQLIVSGLANIIGTPFGGTPIVR